jgi:hypothetical protein
MVIVLTITPPGTPALKDELLLPWTGGGGGGAVVQAPTEKAMMTSSIRVAVLVSRGLPWRLGFVRMNPALSCFLIGLKQILAGCPETPFAASGNTNTLLKAVRRPKRVNPFHRTLWNENRKSESCARMSMGILR